MAVNLSGLKPARRKDKPKRVGRGESSGLGKTCGRGHKGQNSRAGTGKTHGAFEGGQMPLARRVPKRGFNNIFRVPTAEVNIRDLNRFEAGGEVDPEKLRAAGLCKKGKRIKVLAKGEIEKALHVKAHAFSQKAVQKIEAAGGKAEVIG